MNVAILWYGMDFIKFLYAVLNIVQLSYFQLYVFTVTFRKCPKTM